MPSDGTQGSFPSPRGALSPARPSGGSRLAWKRHGMAVRWRGNESGRLCFRTAAAFMVRASFAATFLPFPASLRRGYGCRFRLGRRLWDKRRWRAAAVSSAFSGNAFCIPENGAVVRLAPFCTASPLHAFSLAASRCRRRMEYGSRLWKMPGGGAECGAMDPVNFYVSGSWPRSREAARGKGPRRTRDSKDNAHGFAAGVVCVGFRGRRIFRV